MFQYFNNLFNIHTCTHDKIDIIFCHVGMQRQTEMHCDLSPAIQCPNHNFFVWEWPINKFISVSFLFLFTNMHLNITIVMWTVNINYFLFSRLRRLKCNLNLLTINIVYYIMSKFCTCERVGCLRCKSCYKYLWVGSCTIFY